MRLLLLLILLVSCGQDVIVKEYKGIDGNSCFTSTDRTGINIQCTDGTISHLDYPKNGVNGIDGQNGKDSQGIEIIELCKDIKNKKFTEIALRFPDGQLIAVFSYNNGYLVSLESNTWYQTSDGFSCLFYVDNNMNIEYK